MVDEQQANQDRNADDGYRVEEWDRRTMTQMSDSAHAVAPYLKGAHGVVFQVETTKLLPWLITLSMLAAFAISTAIFCFYQLSKTETQFRLIDDDYQQLNVILAQEGIHKNAQGYYIKDKQNEPPPNNH